MYQAYYDLQNAKADIEELQEQLEELTAEVQTLRKEQEESLDAVDYMADEIRSYARSLIDLADDSSPETKRSGGW